MRGIALAAWTPTLSHCTTRLGYRIAAARRTLGLVWLECARILTIKAFARAKRPCISLEQSLLQASEVCMPHRLAIPCHELRSAYAEGHSSTTIAQRYDCSPTTIIKYLRRCGFPIRLSRFQSRVVPEAALRRLYLEERLPLAAIAAYFGVSVSTINNRRRRYTIPTRSRRLLPPRADSAG